MRKNELGRLEMYPLPPVKQASIVFIGEYPNIEELRAGEYFISLGADALVKTIKNNEIDITDCYFTNAVPYLMSKKNKVIPVSRWDKERNRILSEIRESGATVVVPLGAMASGLLLNNKNIKITKVLGNILDIPELPGVTIIPNYHPALLFHAPGNYKVFNQIMGITALAYRGVTRNPGKTKYQILETVEELQDLIKQLKSLPYVGCDIETSSLDTYRADFWVMGISVVKNDVKVITRELFLQHKELICELMGQSCRWVWHHGKYDNKVLFWRDIKTARIDEDTMYLHYCINETNQTHGLGTLATMYLGADEYKSKMNSEFNNITTEADYLVHKEDLCERVAIDADYTLQIFHVLSPEVQADAGLKRVYETILMPGANFLKRTEIRGMKTDKQYLVGRVPVYEKKIQHLVDLVVTAAAPFWDPAKYKLDTGARTAGEDFKPTSVKQLAWMIYDRLKLKPTDRGARKRGTGEDVLLSIPNPPEFIIKILDLRKLKKEYSTYVLSYLKCMDVEDKVHATFNLHVTATGRLSCTEPNVQNVPSHKDDVRNAFIASAPNRVLMEVDYSGAELRCLAFLSGDKALTNALVNGDPHSEVAEMLFGSDFDHEQRGIAKTVNFGIAYGRGASDLSITFNVSLEEAQRWIEGWAQTYPDAWAYLQSCERDVRSGDVLVTPYGRRKRVGLICDSNVHDLINEGKNYRVQSTSSDNCFLSAIEAEDPLQEHDAYIINLIHDSLLIDCPADPKVVNKVVRLMSSIMEGMPKKQLQCDVPFKCDVDIGYRWGTFASYDKDTEMVQWETKVFDEESGKNKKAVFTYTYTDWIEKCRTMEVI